MAKSNKIKKITPNDITKTDVEMDKTGNLFDNQSAQKNSIPLEITDTKANIISTFKENYNTSIIGFSLQKLLYVEIHKGNLLQYISSGIIYPSKYSSQKAFIDPQSFNHNALLLSNGLFDESLDNILIQISSNAIDESLITYKSNYALYNGVIPISRILRIFVANSEIKKKILDDSSLRDGGILPENLVFIGTPKNLSKITYVDANINTIDWSDKLQQYDKILGLIAGIRNYSLLTINQSNSFKTISDHYFFAVQAIQSDFGKEIVDGGSISDYYKWLFTKSCPNDRTLLKWIFNRVYDSSNFTDIDTNEFESICFKINAFEGEEKQAEIVFSSLKKSLERKKVLPEILKMNSKQSLALYVFAYLRTYATRQNPELARLDLTNLGFSKYSEYAFATLNFFFGYKQLRNSEDRLNIENKQFVGIIKDSKKPFIKFEMNTIFDYKIIDFVFNQVFGNIIRLSQNDYTQYNNIESQLANIKVKIDGYKYETRVVYGKTYEKLAKTNPIDELLPLLNKLPNDISVFSEFGLCCFRIGLKMNTFSLSDIINNPIEIKKIFSYPKNSLIEAIKDNKIEIDEIKQRIALSQKHKELL